MHTSSIVITLADLIMPKLKLECSNSNSCFILKNLELQVSLAESFGSLHALGPACSITSPYESCAQHKETATFRWLSPFEKASGGSSLRRSPRNSGLRGKCMLFFYGWFSIVSSDSLTGHEELQSFSPRLRGLQESVPSQARVFCNKPDTYNMKYI